MATPKTWTAVDVGQGKLAIIRRGTTFQVERRYVFLDDADDVLEDVAGGRLGVEVEWSAIPSGIQDALLAIDTWTYNQILAQEGME
jgi:hypothetical protein